MAQQRNSTSGAGFIGSVIGLILIGGLAYIVTVILNNAPPVFQFFAWLLVYAVIHALMVLLMGLGLVKDGMKLGSIRGSTAGVPLIIKALTPMYAAIAGLLIVDAITGLMLASNPITLIISVMLIPYMIARVGNRKSSESVLRSANETNALGKAVEQPQQAPDYTAAVRPAESQAVQPDYSGAERPN